MKKLILLLLIWMINGCYVAPTEQAPGYQGPYSMQQPHHIYGTFEAYLMGAGTIKQVNTQARWALLIMDEDADDLPDWWCLCDDSLFPYAQVLKFREANTAIKIRGRLRAGHCLDLTIDAYNWHQPQH